MSYELIITEKPSQAKKIAESLADTKAILKKEGTVSYYEIRHKGKKIMLASAVGHVYSLMEKEKAYKYPSFDIHWVPANLVSKNSSHVSKYITVLKKLAKEADSFTIATDFDVEGEVIGLNVLRFACKQKDAERMKFSTLTKPDLIKAYENKLPHIEWGQANAGETRHFLDWMYGINLSRALSLAIRKGGLFKTLSSGRVQGPSLKLLVDKEKDIRAFIPTPYWNITYGGNVKGIELESNHEKDKFTDEAEAKTVFEKVNKQDGEIKDLEKRQSKTQPPFPFDLTTLQTEAFRSLKISPKDTLAIAQELYTKGYTSYPRTSSQKLPKELELKKLVEALIRHPIYKELAQKILDTTKLVPNEGKKTDPAHPSIYPTGILPATGELEGRDFKIYDIIVRRFLSTFAGAATRETNKIIIDVKGENFITKGTRTVDQGWFEFYGPHVKLEEQEVPIVEKGQEVKYVYVKNEKKMTKPPKRFTPASLIKELEKRNLGTKATRAHIIDTLGYRGYVFDKTLEPTEMGIKTSDIMEEYVPDIVKEDLTRQFEEEMDQIRAKKQTKEKVLDDAKKQLTKILKKFKEKELEIGTKLKESLFESQEIENTIGPCPKCKKGTLMIKYSPKTKQHFIGCNNYPDCKALYNLPGNGKDVRPTDKKCPECDFPMISVGSGRGQKILCFNMECPLKIKLEKEAMNPIVKELLKKPCPNCGSPMLLRKSMYGEFLGCSAYPKCKTIIQIPKNEGDEPKVIDYNKKKPKKKAAKKKTAKKAAKKATKKAEKTSEKKATSKK